MKKFLFKMCENALKKLFIVKKNLHFNNLIFIIFNALSFNRAFFIQQNEMYYFN